MAYDIIFSGLVAGIVSVIINIIIYYLNKKQFDSAKKLKKVDNQLLKVYLPMAKAIEDFKKTMHLNASNPNLIDNINDLKTAFSEIETKNTDTIDEMIMKIKSGFFYSPSTGNLDTFLLAVNEKIKVLKNERQKYQ